MTVPVVDISGNAVIECILGCADADHPPRYEPITALEHVRAKATKALAERPSKPSSP